LYGLFFILALLVLGVVQKTAKKNFDSTGMVFMIASSIKMGIAYFLVRPILHVQPNKIEKINFFAVFVLFLLLETLFTAKILNKK
jgi:cellulose synthase/poly-beta-1,6-N-acetylglucosamine synthase-like glycosyltransferase